jgi:hypothetical protein
MKGNLDMRYWKAYIAWENVAIKRGDWYELNAAKLFMATTALLLANLYPQITTLDWYWYVLLMAFFAALPAYRAFKSMPDLFRRLRTARHH